jgi:hypothetical protein
MNFELLQSQLIQISKLKNNEGQIPDVPKNPRFIKDTRFEKLVKSLQDNPEMLSARELLVYQHENQFIVIGGNMRLRAAKELGYKELPCKILTDLTSEQIRAIVIKDNVSFGSDDFESLSNEWDSLELEEWGMELPIDDKIDNLEDDDVIEFEQSVQLEPPKEYILIMAEPNSIEWEEIKEILKLKMVRRGGYKKGSAFDSVGLERVILWNDFKKRLNVNSDTK